MQQVHHLTSTLVNHSPSPPSPHTPSPAGVSWRRPPLHHAPPPGSTNMLTTHRVRAQARRTSRHEPSGGSLEPSGAAAGAEPVRKRGRPRTGSRSEGKGGVAAALQAGAAAAKSAAAPDQLPAPQPAAARQNSPGTDAVPGGYSVHATQLPQVIRSRSCAMRAKVVSSPEETTGSPFGQAVTQFNKRFKTTPFAYQYMGEYRGFRCRHIR